MLLFEFVSDHCTITKNLRSPQTQILNVKTQKIPFKNNNFTQSPNVKLTENLQIGLNKNPTFPSFYDQNRSKLSSHCT